MIKTGNPDLHKPLYLTKYEVRYMQENEKGHGRDGFVYDLHNGYLIKLYHAQVNAVFNNTTPEQEPMQYYDLEKKLVNSAEAMERIKKRQGRVKNTELLKNQVYCNGVLIGCVINNKKGVQIHKLTGMPLNYRKKILKDIIRKLDELITNCIYPQDLSNSPFVDITYIYNDDYVTESGHSNILVNPLTAEAKLIDLEGKSTIYTEIPSLLHQSRTLQDFAVLINEFLFQVPVEDYESDEEVAYMLHVIGLKKHYIEALVSHNITLELALEIINQYNYQASPKKTLHK